jgi:hypothetical protein
MLPISICFSASGFGKPISITLLDLHSDFIAHSSLIILGSCLFLACKWQNGCQLDMYCTVYEVSQFKSSWTHWLRQIEGKYIFLPQKIILLKSLHVISIISPLSWSGSCFWLLSSLSSPSLLCFVRASQHHDPVFPLLPPYMLVNVWYWSLPTAKSLWSLCGCYVRWSLPYMLKVSEDACDFCCCSNHSHYLRVLSLPFPFADMLLELQSW